jgi:hypothetical protein
MDFILDDIIDNYIQDAEAFDRKVAQHLKEIIPNTTHLDENIFLEIIEDLKKEMSLDPALKNMPEIVHKNLKISEVIEDIQFIED